MRRRKLAEDIKEKNGQSVEGGEELYPMFLTKGLFVRIQELSRQEKKSEQDILNESIRRGLNEMEKR